MTATEYIEADLVIFNININAEGKSPQEAFNTHKKRERVLAELLKEFEIKDEDIRFQPISINKRYRNDNRSQVSMTNQQVSVTFGNFDIYEEIQVTLIENGFDSFNGSFSSTQLQQGKDKALIKAIESAKQKAQLIASTTGVPLGEVITINYSDYMVSTPITLRGTNSLMVETADASMMDFEQSVSVTASISIEFGIN
ncbi:MAG: DUF541 domain-containing protein [Balneola sp.]|nr:MAG: DUF541 domain-containing protein [Balneola sp.]